MIDRGLPIDVAWLDRAVETVRSGQIVAIAFERLFGLAADALDPVAVAQVAAIKGRPKGAPGPQPIAVILPEKDAVFEVASDFPSLARRLADAHWPGLLTLLVSARPGLPAPLVSQKGLIGVRLPGPCPAAVLAHRSNLVLTATSANPPGGADARSHEMLADLRGVACVVKGQVPGPPGSTVVDASGDQPVIIRPGAVDILETQG